MKKVFSLFLIISLIFISSLNVFAAYDDNSIAVAAHYEPGKYMTTASALNFRTQPSTSSSIICTIPLGTIVTITKVNNDWGNITYNGKSGWISLQYAYPYDEASAVPSEYNVKWNVIDISKWQGDIDWSKVAKTDIKAVIIRLGLRGSATKEMHIDDRFLEYYQDAIKIGLHVGCYFYSAATTETEAKEEAKFIIDAIKKYNLKFDMPVYLDMEDKVVEKTGKTQIFNTTKAFLDVMKKENIFAGVYCSTSWAEDYYNPALLVGHSLWIADWRSECKYKGEYGMWQYTDSGKVSGITDNYTDLNICYVNYPQLIKDRGYNIADNMLDRIKGDIDADKTITAADARLALRASAMLLILEDKAYEAADMNLDGEITADDARKILRISAQLE